MGVEEALSRKEEGEEQSQKVEEEVVIPMEEAMGPSPREEQACRTPQILVPLPSGR